MEVQHSFIDSAAAVALDMNRGFAHLIVAALGALTWGVLICAGVGGGCSACSASCRGASPDWGVH